MKELSIAEDIVPLGQFKTHASRLLKRIASGSGPLVITQNGRPAGVVLSPAEYDRIRYRERLLESIAAGVTDADTGRVMDTQSLREQLAERRGNHEKA